MKLLKAKINMTNYLKVKYVLFDCFCIYLSTFRFAFFNFFLNCFIRKSANIDTENRPTSSIEPYELSTNNNRHVLQDYSHNREVTDYNKKDRELTPKTKNSHYLSNNGLKSLIYYKKYMPTNS